MTITFPAFADLVSGTGTRSFAVVSTAPGDWLVIESITEGDSGADAVPTPSDGSLTYLTKNDTGQHTGTDVRIWHFAAQDIAGGSRTVTLTVVGASTYRARLTVVRGSSGPGTGTGFSITAQTVSIARQGNNSAMFMSIGDWSAGTVAGAAVTPGGAVLASQQVAGAASYVFGRWDDAGPAGTAAHGLSTPAFATPSVAILEMLAAVSAPDDAGGYVPTPFGFLVPGSPVPDMPFVQDPRSTDPGAAPPPPPPEDSSQPSPVSTSGSIATTDPFTPLANTLIVATAVTGNTPASGTVTVPVTDSLGSSWTLLKRTNGAGQGSAEVWAMDAGSTPVSRTVTATGTGGAQAKGVALTVRVLTGMKPAASQPGATNGFAGTTAYDISLTTTTTGSLVVGGIVDRLASGTLTPNAQTTSWQAVSDTTNSEKYGTWRATALTGTPGSVTTGFSNTAGSSQTNAVVEILAATAAAPSTISPPAVTISGTAQAGAVATPSTIAPAAAVVSGTAQAGAAATPATISGSATISGVASASATTGPATIAPSVVTVSGTASASATVAPATIAPSVVAISGVALTGNAPATIAPSAVVISGAASVSKTVTVSAIAPVAVTISGTAQAGAAAAVATISPPAVTVSGAASASRTATPGTVVGSTVISGQAQAGAAVGPATILGAAVIGPHTAGAATIVPVSTVTGSTAVSGTPATGSTVSAATIAPVKVVISGTAQAGTAPAPATIAPAAVVISGTAVSITTVTPATVLGSVSISGTASAGSVAVPATIAPAVAAISGAASVSKTVAVSTIAPVKVAIPAPTLTSPVLIAVSTITGSAAVGPHIIRAGAAALVATIFGIVTMPPTVQTSGYVTPGEPVVTGVGPSEPVVTGVGPSATIGGGVGPSATIGGAALAAAVTGDPVRAGIF